MTVTAQSISPLRQCMMDDMRMRKVRAKTQSAYIRAVVQLAWFLDHSPYTARREGIEQP